MYGRNQDSTNQGRRIINPKYIYDVYMIRLDSKTTVEEECWTNVHVTKEILAQYYSQARGKKIVFESEQQASFSFVEGLGWQSILGNNCLHKKEQVWEYINSKVIKEPNSYIYPHNVIYKGWKILAEEFKGSPIVFFCDHLGMNKDHAVGFESKEDAAQYAITKIHEIEEETEKHLPPLPFSKKRGMER